jgi:hypothetical protein
MPVTPSISTWNRVEPRPRATDIKPTLCAELRDPTWLLGRQWQFGEFSGEDAASPAFIDLAWRTTDLRKWSAGTVTAAVDGKAPLEQPTLSEPHAADQATRVELGQVFLRLLGDAYGPSGVPAGVRSALLLATPLPASQPTVFNTLEESTRQFELVTLGRAIDGFALMPFAQANTIPNGITGADATTMKSIYAAYLAWIKQVYGSIGTTAPAAWDPQHLDNFFTITAGPVAAPTATLSAQPDADGRLEWSSFDLASQTSDPFTGATPEAPLRIAPAHVRFPGMPAPRYWDFEEGDLAFPDIDIEKRDLQKMLVVEFALISGIDWFALPLDVSVGKIAHIDSLVVHDVFGGTTTINRADQSVPPSTSRWTMFSVSQPGGGIANFTIVPPSAGPGLVTGPVIEEVRFARDENANMAWAIERTTESRMSEPRSGSERDAAADAATPTPPPGPIDPNVPLKYQIESKVPLNWIPLVAVPDPTRPPAIQLQKARVLRPGSGATPTPVAVPPIGKILKLEPYLLPEEEIPRAGLRIERVIFRSRWIDGSSHLWVARRRSGGAGETQSGLRFDASLPNGT